MNNFKNFQLSQEENNNTVGGTYCYSGYRTSYRSGCYSGYRTSSYSNYCNTSYRTSSYSTSSYSCNWGSLWDACKDYFTCEPTTSAPESVVVEGRGEAGDGMGGD